jgi:hypothetical protein
MEKVDYAFSATLLDSFSFYQLSESEFAEQEFIDRINRVPIKDVTALEHIDKGLAFNNAIDLILDTGEFLNTNWGFQDEIIYEIGLYLNGAIKQHYTSCTITVDGKKIMIYGYVNYILYNKCIELKTTSSYDLGNYRDNMQRHIYSYCLNEHGYFIDTFEFIVTDFTSVYKEPYMTNIKESKAIINYKCQSLIKFIESKRHLITDLKIFGNEAGN